MVKDYFQDILPPEGGRRPVPVQKQQPKAAPAREPALDEEETSDDDVTAEDVGLVVGSAVEPPEKSIRNISAPQRRVREDMQRPVAPMPKKRSSRLWVWIIAALALVVAAGLLLISMRGTSVALTPRAHAVIFDETSRFVAYPSQNAASGTLSYVVQTLDLQESESVTASGTAHAEEKASGPITVYNEYSAAPVKLVKNTRFEAAGMIFRAPADIVVPGRQGTTAGQVTITVIADQPGESFNIAPSRFSLPGLKGTAEFSKLYAQSSAAMTGGFSGERPAIADGELQAAHSAIRGRLEQKIIEAVKALSTDQTIAFPELSIVRYEDAPVTTVEGGAQVKEIAHVSVPVLTSASFAQSIARTVAADDVTPVILVPGKEFTALMVNASTTLGTDPLQFGLSGTGELIWQIDSIALAQALAGRDKSAFQTIVNGFPAIESAKARIEPFWSHTFPSDAHDIRVVIGEPKVQ